MKKIIIGWLIAFSVSSFAVKESGYHFVCQEYDFKTGEMLNKTLVLAPIGKGFTSAISSGLTHYVEIYENLATFTDESFMGTIEKEDVVFDFNSKDGKVNFTVFLDELEQSSLTVIQDGKEVRSTYFCR